MPTAELARLFLVSDSAMGARWTRAKRALAAARVSFTVPEGDELDERLVPVINAVYLAFTAGFAPASGSAAVQLPLADEAVRLARLLRRLLPRPELDALLALLGGLDRRLPRNPQLAGICARLLSDAGRTAEARHGYEQALTWCRNEAQAAELRRQLEDISGE